MKETKSKTGKPGREKRKRTQAFIIYQAHELFSIRFEKINDNSCII